MVGQVFVHLMLFELFHRKNNVPTLKPLIPFYRDLKIDIKKSKM